MKLPTKLQVENLVEHYHNFRYSEAEKLALSMNEEFTDFPISWKVLGAIFMRTCRMHSAVYGGSKDRIMIGVNFYSL